VYDYFEGEVAQHSATRLVVDVGGVGYELSVPLGYAWPVGRPARVFAHLAVRDDAHQLYGFPDRATRDLFRQLLTVSGVGPRLALGLLSGLPRLELLAALANDDRARLLALKGIGKRIVDQLLLAFSDKAKAMLAAEAAEVGEAPEGPAGPLPVVLDDAVAALVSIGYAEKDARKQVERAAASLGSSADLELLVRNALAG
jgi:Holliday junction DNA helicase RuvA